MSERGAELKLGPAARIRIIRSDAEELVVEATYAAGSPAPPDHLHPEQDETFEILEGAMQVKVGAAEERTLRAGETLDVPRGTPHMMWNAADAAARTKWVTRPAGRTEEWFRTLDSFQRRTESGETVKPDEYTRALAEYRDVFRIVQPD